MIQLDSFALLIFAIQVFHSIEELTTGFHKRWYLTKLSFKTFLIFEICFTLLWGLVIYIQDFPLRDSLLLFFIALMFANGVQHVVWAGAEKKYVPGLVTGVVHIIAFFLFYFQLVKFV